MTKTCVITVNYRGASDTAACVKSLLAATVPVEIVVVDTTPDDPDLEAALRFAPGLTLIRASDNVGFGCGNNLGIDWAFAHTSCEFIFLFNNDAIVFPATIERLEAAMAANLEVGIMTPRIAYLDEPEKLWYGGGEVDWWRSGAVAPGFNQSAQAQLAMTERDVTFASGCALFVRRSVLKELRGFDPRFFMYEEDVELCLRASESGIRIRYIPHSLVLHRVQGSSRDSSNERRDFWSAHGANLTFYAYHVIRNRLLNADLHAHGKQRIIVAVSFPLFLIRRAIPLLLRGRVDAVLAMFRGIAGFWRTRPSRNVARSSSAFGQDV